MMVIPAGTPIVHISTLEEAAQFTMSKDSTVKIEQSQPVASWDEILMRVAKPNYDFIEGRLELWREDRYPSSWLYSSAEARILDEIVFELLEGWHRDFDKIDGTRITEGLRLCIKSAVLNLDLDKLKTNT